MPNFKIELAYDGAGFVGWQRQAGGVSIQGVLEDALHELDQRDVAVAGAGRTDAGVHALGQVAAFPLARALSADALVRALNAHLPAAIRVLSADEVPPDFHPRFGARAKTYRYRIWNGDVLSPFERGYAWHVPGALDVEAMAAAAGSLCGAHDFASFQASGASTSTTGRVVYASQVSRHAVDAGPAAHGRIDGAALALPTPGPHPLVVYDVRGGGFLRHMVRIIVGTLVEIGRGRRPAAWMHDVLASRDRRMAGPTAPPGGLFLVSVDYETETSERGT
jgi:tRNA pseudouridine38-40 synthase